MGAWGVSLSKLNAGSLNRRGDVGLAGRGDVGLASEMCDQLVRSDAWQTDVSFMQERTRAIWQGLYKLDRLCFCRIRFLRD